MQNSGKNLICNTPARLCKQTVLLNKFTGVYGIYHKQPWQRRRGSVDVIFLDFAKAFEKVPHARLLHKISVLGIQGKQYMWIKNWLQDRRQRVVLNGHISTWEAVGSDVPQWSVLRPLLFTIFININYDIDENLTNRLLKFTDDTKILGKVFSHQDAQSMLEDLKKISQWSETWQMNFNLEQCKVLHLGPRNSKTKFDRIGHNLEEITEERDLGIIISHDGKAVRNSAPLQQRRDTKLLA